MKNCLVKKLKGSVNNPSLPKLDELILYVNDYGVAAGYVEITFNSNTATTVRIVEGNATMVGWQGNVTPPENYSNQPLNFSASPTGPSSDYIRFRVKTMGTAVKIGISRKSEIYSIGSRSGSYQPCYIDIKNYSLSLFDFSRVNGQFYMPVYDSAIIIFNPAWETNFRNVSGTNYNFRYDSGMRTSSTPLIQGFFEDKNSLNNYLDDITAFGFHTCGPSFQPNLAPYGNVDGFTNWTAGEIALVNSKAKAALLPSAGLDKPTEITICGSVFTVDGSGNLLIDGVITPTN